MATLERTYIIPLRKQVNKSPKYKRAKKAASTVRIFLEKHMKSKDVKLGQELNMLLWERGMKNPPGKVKVTVIRDEKGTARAELFGHKYIDKKKAEKAPEKSKLEQLKEKMLGEKKEDKQAEHNKEAIAHIPEHDHHDHSHAPAEHDKELKNVKEKLQKVSTGKTQAQQKDKQ